MPTCDQVLEACDFHVDNLEARVDKQLNIILTQQERLVDLEDEVAYVEWYVYVLIGVAGGVLAMEIAR